MKDFAKAYGFKDITNGPHYPQGQSKLLRLCLKIKNIPISHYSAIKLCLLLSAGCPQLNYLWAVS